MKQRSECCAQCPFARSTSKKYLDTRGQNGPKFIGQAHGAFILPCHMERDFEEWAENMDEIPQCAGAAKFRANIGVGEKMPDQIGKLDSDTELVFSSPEELLAHHMGVPIEAAKFFLDQLSPEDLLRLEMMEAREKQRPIKKATYTK